MPVTQHPLHRSVRAELPHTAPASGSDDQTLAWIGVAYFGMGKPMLYQSVHAFPRDGALAATAQRASPQSGHFTLESHEALPVIGHAKVSSMSCHHGFEVFPLFRNRLMHTLSHFQLERLKFSPQSLGTGQSQDRKFALPGFAAAMRESQKVKGLRFSLSSATAVASGIAPEFNQSRLLWMQRQSKYLEPFSHVSLEAFGVALVLKPGNPIIGVAHDDDIAYRMARSPLFHPQVKRIVQVDVGQQGTDTPALDRKFSS